MKVVNNLYNRIVGLEHLFWAWDEFKKGKGRKKDVMKFEFNLEDNIFKLYKELVNKNYSHGPYYSFYIHDPKQRNINKALVRDRIVHHAIFSVLNPIFEPTFIDHSYSCRIGKGTHRGVEALAGMMRKVSRNNTRPCYVLKCDVRKFFFSVDHDVLLSIIYRRVKDFDTLWLLQQILESFPSGLPIGNLTSQLFANVYMNELDQFVKQKLKTRNYIRYTDDFVVVANSVTELENSLAYIRMFLNIHLKLDLHPNKVTIRKYHQGIDFLGYMQFPYHRILRNKTQRRMLKKVDRGISEDSLHSYLGVLSHCDAVQLSAQIKNEYWLRQSAEK